MDQKLLRVHENYQIEQVFPYLSRLRNEKNFVLSIHYRKNSPLHPVLVFSVTLLIKLTTI